MTTHIQVDLTKQLIEDPTSGHNRLHPDIPPIVRVEPGELVVVDLRDGMDGQITAKTTAPEIHDVDGRRGLPLTGPIYVNGAEPGDLLDIEVLNISPGSYGWTAILPGFTYLADRFPDPYVVHWDIADGVATSVDLPGVAVRGAPFLGAMLVAPSHDELEQFRAREQDLAASGAVVPLPDPEFAIPSAEPLAREALRLVPPRENGGNMDVRQLTAGSKLTLRVRVPGGLFSAGDPHFAQGEGESGGSAIETTATACFRFRVRKKESVRWTPRMPVVEFSEAGRRYIMTTGISVTDDGRNLDMDLKAATRVALIQMIDYLVHERGYSDQQAAILTGAAVDLRESEVVNPPNVLVGAVLPMDIFTGSGRFDAPVDG